jgi:phage shock protein A
VIAQREREAEQWKEQCTTLQQTFKETVAQLRVESEHWKAQYHQLEQEHTKLLQNYKASQVDHVVRRWLHSCPGRGYKSNRRRDCP